MKHWFFLILLVMPLFLFGCKVESESSMNISQLNAQPTIIESLFKVEVSSCKDHQDQSKPSRSLMEANENIAKILPSAKYIECKNVDFENYAFYSVPMLVGETKKSELKGADIGVISNKNGDTFFAVSEKLAHYIKKQEKLTLVAKVHIKNDSMRPMAIYPYSCYVDEEPFAGLPSWNLKKDIKAGEMINIKISDVSSDFALKNGMTPLYHLKEKGK